jgi:hypothetical protein
MAAWRRAIELSLGDADVVMLRSMAQSRTEPASRVERARILLGIPESGILIDDACQRLLPYVKSSSAAPGVPIIFIGISEPVAVGFVASLAHLGGNITGFSKSSAAHTTIC